MALTAPQTVAVQLEHVRKVVPLLYERSTTTYSMIEKRPVDQVSTRTARIPLQVQPGGDAGVANLDGGDLGRGSGTVYDVAQITPSGMKFAVEITKLVEYATNNSEKAIANVAKKNVVDAMAQFRKDIDTWLQTAGNGVLATLISSGAVTGTTYTLTDTPFGARLLRPNITIQVYDTTLATNRGSAKVVSVQNRLGQTQKVTIDVDPGAQNSDNLVVGGASGASPVWLYGIPYHHNTATTGTWLGISRANDYAVANGVNASSAMAQPPLFRLAINQIRQVLGEDAVAAGLKWHTHPAQAAAVEEYGLALQFIPTEGGGQKDQPDMLFRKASIGGFEIKEAIHADTSRMDLLNLNTWGRVEWAPVDYLDIGGNTVFPVYGASGGIAAAYLFYFVAGMQFFVDNPKALTSVTSLSLPTGYN